METEIVYISDVEFANIAQDLPKTFSQNRGKQVVNEFQKTIKEVVGSKYGPDAVFLDFENCLPKEKQTLRNEYARIKKEIRKNIKKSKNWSDGLDATRIFISSEKYKTLVVSVPRPPKNAR